MHNINWGIIGCGEVTEVKSGPAFNKTPHSTLVAVMRRNTAMAQNYAFRHQVPKWYSSADDLINDPEINAVYIATPPSAHLEYAVAALKAGKMVYVEKPMTNNLEAAHEMQKAVKKYNGKLSVAHYRREQPLFLQLKKLINEKSIGRIKLITLCFFRKNLSANQLNINKYAWRVNPEIAGGGLFHDIAPHQLDMLYHLFGEADEAQGYTTNTNTLYTAADTICGTILFRNKILFSGRWCFNIGKNKEVDSCEIIGEEGKIIFSFFDSQQIIICKNGKTEINNFEKLPHAQQPMIHKVVDYFLGNSYNPCSVEEGVKVMGMMEKFTAGIHRR